MVLKFQNFLNSKKSKNDGIDIIYFQIEQSLWSSAKKIYSISNITDLGVGHHFINDIRPHSNSDWIEESIDVFNRDVQILEAASSTKILVVVEIVQTCPLADFIVQDFLDDKFENIRSIIVMRCSLDPRAYMCLSNRLYDRSSAHHRLIEATRTYMEEGIGGIHTNLFQAGTDVSSLIHDFTRDFLDANYKSL